MPRFFLNIREGKKLIPDEEGIDAPDLTATRQHALQDIREILAERIRAGEALDGSLLEITDAKGRKLDSIPFRDVIRLGGPEPPVLTTREREVLTWFGRGKSTEDVAQILGLSPATISFHYDRAAEKLETGNRTQTVAEAIRRGEIEL
ncbi:MAG TPA: helix-turn-helix transcriptional regulator [Devosia sp.]|nr:helix-turn-helix transcriptional regulator [Devosia sp.]